MTKPVEAFKTALFVSLAILLVLSGVIILLLASSSNEVTTSTIKDSLGLLVAVFGGMATILATYMAAILFNDWREQHNAQIKNTYLGDILSILRQDLILIAPILSGAIEASEKYKNQDRVDVINIDEELIKSLYSSHKTADMLMKEYYAIFKDGDNYLLYLKYSRLMDAALTSLIKVNEFASDVEKLEEITKQLQIVDFPDALQDKAIAAYDVVEMLPLDIYYQIENYYLSFTNHIALNRLQ